jgi:hypothetical protein
MLYYAYGSALLSTEEIERQEVQSRVQGFLSGLKRGRNLGPVTLSTGEISAQAFTSSTGRRKGKATEWNEIGVGKPLTLEIREVYTGKHPGGIFASASPMFVASAVKSIATYEAKPLAVNFLTRKTGKNSRLSRPSANQEGTPVVYYSPAVTDRSLTVDLQIVFDEFPQQVFDAIGSAFKSAAGLPVFLSHSAYLLAAGEIIRIAGSIGEWLLDGKTAFQATESIDLDLPGAAQDIAGFMVVTPPDVDKLDPTFRTTYQVNAGTLVDAAGKAYGGEVPYIVLAVDGSKREDLANFAPTAATAAVLSRFYGIKDGQSLPLSPLMDALRLYNDATFREEIDKIDRKLAKVKDDSPEKTELASRRAALEKNILSDLLKPS